jgi:hypothetical protein
VRLPGRGWPSQFPSCAAHLVLRSARNPSVWIRDRRVRLASPLVAVPRISSAGGAVFKPTPCLTTGCALQFSRKRPRDCLLAPWSPGAVGRDCRRRHGYRSGLTLSRSRSPALAGPGVESRFSGMPPSGTVTDEVYSSSAAQLIALVRAATLGQKKAAPRLGSRKS